MYLRFFFYTYFMALKALIWHKIISSPVTVDRFHWSKYMPYFASHIWASKRPVWLTNLFIICKRQSFVKRAAAAVCDLCVSGAHKSLFWKWAPASQLIYCHTNTPTHIYRNTHLYKAALKSYWSSASWKRTWPNHHCVATILTTAAVDFKQLGCVSLTPENRQERHAHKHCVHMLTNTRKNKHTHTLAAIPPLSSYLLFPAALSQSL